MNKRKAYNFIKKYKKETFYQPVVFIPGVLGIRGKWNEATIALADRILSKCKGQTILDIGCNIGFFLRKAIDFGAAQTKGVDLDLHAIQIANEIDDICGEKTNCIAGSIDDCQKSDIVLSMNILHVVKNPASFIEKSIQLSKIKLIMEIENPHLPFFDTYAPEIYDSPRAYGHRKLVIIKKKK